MFKILFKDENIVAIHKPAGLMVHRNHWSGGEKAVLQLLRDQLGVHVFPAHRLDRGTAGVLVMALNSEASSLLNAIFSAREIEKTYLAVVRGFTPESGIIDYPLEKDGDGELQDAVTLFRRLATAELPIPVDRYATSRYSLAEIKPETGRLHQIRRHFAHIRHPIIGDLKRGDRHHNRMFREVLGCEAMLLLAWKLKMKHPISGEQLEIITQPDEAMQKILDRMGWEIPA